MKILKVTLAMLLAVVMLFSLCACSFNIPDLDDLDPNNIIADNTQKDKDDKNSKSGKFDETTIDFEGCKIVVLGAEKITDSDEKPALRIWFDVTNTSDKTEYPFCLYEFSATQDDYELVDTYAGYDYSVPEEYNYGKYIRPGVTIRVVEEISFKENGGIVKVSFTDFLDEDTAKIVEFDPAKLSGAPKDEFKPEPITDPKWTKNLKSEGVLKLYDEDFEFKIDGYDFAEDYNSDKLIRVYVAFKNTSSEKKSLSSLIYPKVFQDGIQLDFGIAVDEVDEDGNYDLEIEPGKSVSAALCYKLCSDSPVEVELNNYIDSSIGAVFEVK